MARVDTDKKINPTQLGIELGRVPLRVSAGRYVDAEGVDEAALRDAIDAHVADDGYVDPEAPPPPPDPDDELDAGLAEVAGRDDVPEWGLALIANLRGKAGHQGRAAGSRPE